eukprot:718678-Amorphochlora_amoeboformis.AAC.1
MRAIVNIKTPSRKPCITPNPNPPNPHLDLILSQAQSLNPNPPLTWGPTLILAAASSIRLREDV